MRTALGVATLSFYFVLFLGGAADIVAATFQLSVNQVLVALRVLVIVVPVVSAWAAYRLCKELAARDDLPTLSPVRPRDVLSRLLRGAPKPARTTTHD